MHRNWIYAWGDQDGFKIFDHGIDRGTQRNNITKITILRWAQGEGGSSPPLFWSMKPQPIDHKFCATPKICKNSIGSQKVWILWPLSKMSCCASINLIMLQNIYTVFCSCSILLWMLARPCYWFTMLTISPSLICFPPQISLTLPSCLPSSLSVVCSLNNNRIYKKCNIYCTRPGQRVWKGGARQKKFEYVSRHCQM